MVRNPVESPQAMAETQDDEELADPTKYQHAIGSLMYAMVATKPDLAYVVGKLSQNNRCVPSKKGCGNSATQYLWPLANCRHFFC